MPDDDNTTREEDEYYYDELYVDPSNHISLMQDLINTDQ